MSELAEMLIQSKGVASGMIGILTEEEALKEDRKASVISCSSMMMMMTDNNLKGILIYTGYLLLML